MHGNREPTEQLAGWCNNMKNDRKNWSHVTVTQSQNYCVSVTGVPARTRSTTGSQIIMEV